MSENPKQHTLWLLAALTAPIAHFAGCGWLMALLTAVVTLPLTLLPKKWEDLPKTVAWIELFWLGVVAGTLLPGSAAYWPSDNDLVVPLTLLALAVFTNAAAAPRIGAVLALCMALLSVPVMLSAVSRLEPAWLQPTATPWPVGLTLALLLPTLPAAGDQQKGRRAIYAALLTLLLTILVQGVIATPVAAALPDPFYQTARTLGHLEPVVAAGLSLGWYSLTCYLLRSATAIAKNSGISQRWADVLVSGTVAFLVIFPQQPNALFVLVLSLFLWVLTPFVRKINGFEKN